GADPGVGVQEQEERTRAAPRPAIAAGAVAAVDALADQPRTRDAPLELARDAVPRSVVDHDDLGPRRGLLHGTRRRHGVLGSLVVDDHRADARAWIHRSEYTDGSSPGPEIESASWIGWGGGRAIRSRTAGGCPADAWERSAAAPSFSRSSSAGSPARIR